MGFRYECGRPVVCCDEWMDERVKGRFRSFGGVGCRAEDGQPSRYSRVVILMSLLILLLPESMRYNPVRSTNRLYYTARPPRQRCSDTAGCGTPSSLIILSASPTCLMVLISRVRNRERMACIIVHPWDLSLRTSRCYCRGSELEESRLRWR